VPYVIAHAHLHTEFKVLVTSTGEVHIGNIISQNRPNKYGQWYRTHNEEPSLNHRIA